MMVTARDRNLYRVLVGEQDVGGGELLHRPVFVLGVLAEC